MKLDWKQLLKLNQYEVFGLDIGSSAVKIVQMRKNDADYIVTAAGIAQIQASEDGNNNNEMNIVRAIRDCLQSAGIKAQLAVCSVCGPEVAVRHFKFPALPPEELEGAILLEAEQVCPFSVGDSTVDYHLIPNGENETRGVLVAATNKLIKRKNLLIENASLKNALMDVDGLAVLNCSREYEKLQPSLTTAILNVGSHYTNLAIMGNNSLPFVRDISYAANDIVRKIAVKKDVSPEVVRKALFGGENSSQPDSEFTDDLKNASEKLIIEAADTLRYYATQENPVEKILVCGGFAPAKGFVEMLNERFPAQTMLWNPFDKIDCQSNRYGREVIEKNSSAMVVAAGLAMRSV